METRKIVPLLLAIIAILILVCPIKGHYQVDRTGYGLVFDHLATGSLKTASWIHSIRLDLDVQPPTAKNTSLCLEDKNVMKIKSNMQSKARLNHVIHLAEKMLNSTTGNIRQSNKFIIGPNKLPCTYVYNNSNKLFQISGLCSEKNMMTSIDNLIAEHMYEHASIAANSTLLLFPLSNDETDNSQTIGHTNSRTKRNILLNMANLFWSGFNSYEIYKVKHHVNDLDTRIMNITENINTFHHDFASYAKMSIRHQKLMEDQIKETQISQQIVEQELTEINRQHFRMLDLIYTLGEKILKASRVMSATSQIESELSHLANNRLSPMVLPWNEAKEILQFINTNLNTMSQPSSVAFSNSDPKKFYSEVKFITYRKESSLVINLIIPLIDERFKAQFFRLIYVPLVLNASSQHTMELTESAKYIGIADNNKYMSTFDDASLINQPSILTEIIPTTNNCIYGIFNDSKENVMTYCKYKVKFHHRNRVVKQLSNDQVFTLNVKSLQTNCIVRENQKIYTVSSSHIIPAGTHLTSIPGCCEAIFDNERIVASFQSKCTNSTIKTVPIINVNFISKRFGIINSKPLRPYAHDDNNWSYDVFTQRSQQLASEISQSELDLDEFLSKIDDSYLPNELFDEYIDSKIDLIGLIALILTIILIPCITMIFLRTRPLIMHAAKIVAIAKTTEFPQVEARSLVKITTENPTDSTHEHCQNDIYTQSFLYGTWTFIFVISALIALIKAYKSYVNRKHKNAIFLSCTDTKGEILLIKWFVLDSDVEKYHIEWSQQIPHDLRRSGTCIGSQLSFSTGDLKIQNVEDKNMVHVPNDIFLDYWETEKLTNLIEKEMFIEVVYSPNGKIFKNFMPCESTCQGCAQTNSNKA